MKAELIRIGNSRGLRIPKVFIRQCGLGETVDLRIENNCLIVSPEHKARQGWGEAFRAAGQSSDDELMLEKLPPSRFDREEWQW